MASTKMRARVRVRRAWLVAIAIEVAEMMALVHSDLAVRLFNAAVRLALVEIQLDGGRWQSIGPLDLEAS